VCARMHGSCASAPLEKSGIGLWVLNSQWGQCVLPVVCFLLLLQRVCVCARARMHGSCAAPLEKFGGMLLVVVAMCAYVCVCLLVLYVCIISAGEIRRQCRV